MCLKTRANRTKRTTANRTIPEALISLLVLQNWRSHTPDHVIKGPIPLYEGPGAPQITNHLIEDVSRSTPGSLDSFNGLMDVAQLHL